MGIYNYLFDKKIGKLFFTGCFFTRAPPSTPRALVIQQLFLALEKNPVEKSFFFLSNMKFCLCSRGVESILERPITCVSALYDARQAS
jgi:hypothetical protein